MKLIEAFCKILNLVTPKVEHSMYVATPFYTVSSNLDVINCNSSNAYFFVNRFVRTKHEDRITLYIEYYHEDRISLYKELVRLAADNNVDLYFIKHYQAYSSKRKKLLFRFKNLLTKYKTLYWITETGDQGSIGKLQSQKVICLNYFISCKNDLVPGSNIRWDTIDTLMTSSLLHSQIISSSTGVKLENCMPLGMARNDSLKFQHQRRKIEEDIEKELGYKPKYIFLYAPTYRDYENENSANRDLLGYEADDFGSFLIKNQVAFVHKLHRGQASNIVSFPQGTVKFNICFEYSFYDLMSIADCLITDYSSIGFDFLLLDKPLIYNLYDFDLYEKTRGMSYDPYYEFCPGEIVKNYEQLIQAMKNIIEGKDLYGEKRKFIKKLIYKYADFNSTDRIIEYFDSIL